MRKCFGVSHKVFNKTKKNYPCLTFTYQKNHKQKNIDIVKTFRVIFRDISPSRGENTWILAGKKETSTSFKTKKQKRILSDTVLNLYQKLMLEMPHLKLSYSLFGRIKP
ncbi:hypothetical protein AMECASPLE_039117 [Ameca splendens]|uniref:Uncharacterized protein n=1 Tax=Ameca splendens TaxID=208324 RepID=A0ABV0XX90_9TELE